MRIEHKRYWSLFLAGLSISFFLFWNAFDYSKQSLIKASHEHIPQKHRSVLKAIDAFKADKNIYLEMLIQHPDVLSYLSSPDETTRKQVKEFFYHQVKSTENIMQMRLLGIDGKEKNRIDRSADRVFSISDEKLQDKSNRDYFLQFKKLKPDEIGFSKLDLNVENNRVEVPFKPTIRIAMPVYIHGDLRGIVIVNYDMAGWLEQLSDSAFLNIYLIDPNGNFILHPDPAMRWSGYRTPPVSAKTFFDHKTKSSENEFIRYDNLLTADIRLWNNESYTIVYEPKEQASESINERITVVGLLIFGGIVMLLLPFAKLLFEYVRNIQSTRLTLQESEQRLKAIFENTFDAIIIINSSGHIQRCNKATSSIFGYSEAELLGQNVNLLVPEPHHSRHDDYIRLHDKTITSKIIGQERELFGLHKEGYLIPVSLGVTQVQIDNELYFIGTLRDISHEKRNKQLFENVFQQAPVGVAVVLETGQFWRLNNKFCDIIGYTEEEMRALTFQEITYPDDLEIDLALVAQVAAGKIPTYTLEKRYIHKNGSIIWINLTVSAIFLDKERLQLEYFIAMVEDISERKAMVEKLSLTQQGLIEAERIARIGHWDWNISSDILSWSDSMMELFGENPQTFHANYNSFITRVHPNDRDRVNTAINEALENHPYNIYYRIITGDGIEKTIHAIGNLTLEDGKPVRLFGTCQDVTKIKQLEEKEKDQERMLMQQSKLVAMGEMVGAIAHQWRQPLNTIGLTIQDLLFAYKHGELDEDYLQSSQAEMMQQLKYMSKTIDEFRNFFTKRQAIDAFNLLTAINEVIQLYWAQLKAHDITLILVCRCRDNTVRSCEELNEEEQKRFDLVGASSEYKQVVLNCISNAKDAILALKSADRIQRTITITLQEHENTLDTYISDYAGGMSEDVLNRIFEPYYTTREMGTGLGLYIAKMISERTLKGAISCSVYTETINEHLYEGSRFTLTVPREENNIPLLE